MVNEFPKSGGTWLAQMLADALALPFRRNQPIRLERSVAHGHFLNPRGLHNVVVLWRDPRDLLVSLYYHCYFVNERHNALLVRLMKERLPFDDYEDIRGNLPAFIRFMSTTPVSPRFTWPQFARVWAGRPGVTESRYEALRCDTPGELTRIVMGLTGCTLPQERAEAIAVRHSFERAKARAVARSGVGVEKSFVREGSVGGWRAHVTAEAEAELGPVYLEAMQSLGYEPSKDGDTRC
ncbi:MAG: sulfotransferase domain-containing protein [Nitrococcus sp.]|nr:sulfotransferase domain-containing protein [Nitrococcus sp.]